MIWCGEVEIVFGLIGCFFNGWLILNGIGLLSFWDLGVLGYCVVKGEFFMGMKIKVLDVGLVDVGCWCVCYI